MYLVFTRVQGESYRRRLRSLLLWLCDIFRALISSQLWVNSDDDRSFRKDKGLGMNACRAACPWYNHKTSKRCSKTKAARH